SLYWPPGPADLQRLQSPPQPNGPHPPPGSIHPHAAPVRRSDAHLRIVAHVPAVNDPSRARLERQYNNGQRITGSLLVRRLLPEDRLLVDGNTILVARREGNVMARYWLDGSIDLGQSSVLKIAANLYQVTGSVR
ncbi:MAG: hypothetical protein JSS21_06395, partial [Proteobacteria bacterium]|nr:hypothetical protein [Pseudomonadota bacterium]